MDFLNTREKFISLIIVVYFLIATVQELPDGDLKSSLSSLFGPVISIFGLKQRWSLFAPTLSRLNHYSTCVLTFNDGTMRLLEWPRMDKLTAADKFYLQRVRRFVTEVWASPQWRSFWPFSARNFYHEFKDNSHAPYRIEFIFNSAEIPAFQKYTRREQLPNGYRLDNVFVYFPERHEGKSK